MLPVVVASAQRSHKRGLWALAAGMVLTFAVLGLVLSAFGSVWSLSESILRKLGALGLLVAGSVLVFPRLQNLLEHTRVGWISCPFRTRQNPLSSGFRSLSRLGGRTFNTFLI